MNGNSNNQGCWADSKWLKRNCSKAQDGLSKSHETIAVESSWNTYDSDIHSYFIVLFSNKIAHEVVLQNLWVIIWYKDVLIWHKQENMVLLFRTVSIDLMHYWEASTTECNLIIYYGSSLITDVWYMYLKLWYGTIIFQSKIMRFCSWKLVYHLHITDTILKRPSSIKTTKRAGFIGSSFTTTNTEPASFPGSFLHYSWWLPPWNILIT